MHQQLPQIIWRNLENNPLTVCQHFAEIWQCSVNVGENLTRRKPVVQREGARADVVLLHLSVAEFQRSDVKIAIFQITGRQNSWKCHFSFVNLILCVFLYLRILMDWRCRDCLHVADKILSKHWKPSQIILLSESGSPKYVLMVTDQIPANDWGPFLKRFHPWRVHAKGQNMKSNIY